MDASSTRLGEAQSLSVPESKDTKLLRTIVRSSAIVLAVSITADAFNTTLFALHPIFISVGFLGFMSEGILQAHSFRSLEGSERLRTVWRHATVQIFACISIAIGFGAIYFNKVRVYSAQHIKVHPSSLFDLCPSLYACCGGDAAFATIIQFSSRAWSRTPVHCAYLHGSSRHDDAVCVSVCAVSCVESPLAP